MSEQGFFNGLTSYGDEGFSVFLRRVFLSSMGYDSNDLDRPVIGIADTSSSYVTCHREMPQLVDAIKRGVLEAGGLPVVFPSMSLPEVFTNPTAMYLRNLMALETEELINAQPMDGVVLVGGCDKTVPAQMMGAVSAGLPFVHVVAGPMIPSTWKGQRVGACTDCRAIWGQHRAGHVSRADVDSAAGSLATTGGTCMVMGTASTMACVAEALGVAVPGSATPAAPTGARLASGTRAGRAIVEAVRTGRGPSEFLTADSFWNAAVVLAAIGGSTNAVIHLTAIAGRAGIPFALDDFERAMAGVPVLVNAKPSGTGFMNDFDADGGVPALLRELKGFLRLNALTVEGVTIGQLIERQPPSGMETGGLRPLSDPVNASGGIRVLRGSLAPDGAVIKASAASPHLFTHQGPAVVFDSIGDLLHRIDDPDLEVSADSVLVLRNAGPFAAGMPEAGALPIPRKLAEQGVRDMVRISDARMSGTAFGTIVLHVSPEAAVGGPLALVRDGDLISLDVTKGRVDLLVDSEELQRRVSPPPETDGLPATRWATIQRRYITQAHAGADIDPGREGM